MKVVNGIAALCLLVAASSALAQTSDPAAGLREAHDASSPQARAAAAVNEARMSQLIESMRTEMELLATTENPEERKRLMNSHRGHLHEMLMLLRRTGGVSMSRLMQEHLQAQGESLTPDAEATGEERFESLAMRVDMMQMTLEAMFDHLTMRWGPQ